jgi:hypothetical protein
MVRAALAATLAFAAGTVGLSGSSAQAGPAPARTIVTAVEPTRLLGFVDRTLVPIDAESLAPIAGTRIPVGSGGCAPRQGGTACWTNPPWSVGPGGRQLVVARNDASSLLLVDVAGTRTVATIRVAGGAIGALAWLAPRRLLAVQEAPGERQRLLVLDPATRTVVARRTLGGSIVGLARTARELTMLVAPPHAIGVARMVVAGRRGKVRSVRLARVLAGSTVLPVRGHLVDSRQPGLAVDPDGRRAYVVDQAFVAEVDLTNLAVSYHSLERKPSLLARLWKWLEPAASAKLRTGHYRQAAWLGSGLLAVSGSDSQAGRRSDTGLLAVDPRSWKVRLIERGGTSFRIAGRLLLAWGGIWDEETRRSTGIGIAAYDLEGTKRFHLFDGRDAWVAQVHDGLAYAGFNNETGLRVIDLATGMQVATRPAIPSLLLGSGDGWWGV